MEAGIVSCETLFATLDDCVVFDCRYRLGEPDWGAREYQKGHVPGSFHLHIDRDLSGPVGDGSRGRHPLPLPGAFPHLMRMYGVSADTQVVAYDDAGGPWAARLWWLLRHHGHEAVAVLDGGWQRWKRLGLPQSTRHERPVPGTFDGQPGHMPTIDALRIAAELEGGPGAYQLLDARAPERFRGDVEPIDPVAGHIPGALNAPFLGNLGPEGLFLSPDELRARYEDLLGVQDAGKTAVYCGSGVTAAHDVLALELAGMGTPALYPGSWSEWCQPDGQRPVERSQAVVERP